LYTDHLLGNPHAQPPLPADWEVRPTHPVHAVPYYLASLWDARREREEERKAAAAAAARKASKKLAADADGGLRRDDSVGRVPRALRDTMKRSRAARNMLQELEVEVRRFAEHWNEANSNSSSSSGGAAMRVRDTAGVERRPSSSDDDDNDNDDDEGFVLVHHADLSLEAVPAPVADLAPAPGLVHREKLVFEGPEADRAASFGRWLVHSLGDYYGLDTWSVTLGDPARREAYVGIKSGGGGERKKNKKKTRFVASTALPRPLWARV
jgi:hypothetical protein